MTTCPSCGAQNDPGNRFCDQCGTRLDAPPGATPAVPAADQPTMAAPVCPSCGDTVLPGEAFCDNCGADLTGLAASLPIATPAAPAPADAPTMLAAPSTPIATTAGEVICKVCGQTNLPGERFCDNCGADLSAPAPNDAQAPTAPDDATMLAPPTPSSDAATMMPIPSSLLPPVVLPDDATMMAPPGSSTPPEQPAATPDAPAAPVADATPAASAADLSPVASAAETTAATPVADAAPAAPAAEPAAAPDADANAGRTQLEALLTAHRDTVAQYEQMAGRYPADAAPAFITAGLDAAKAELSKAEADLAALAALPSGPDPAEVTRLEELLAAHRDTVAQYEQMAGRYPAGAAPAFITAGLDAAKAELTRAEGELAVLVGSTPVAAVPEAAASTQAAPAVPSVPDPLATITVPPPAAVTAPAGPRLVVAEGGQALPLPLDKAEIIIGREDPVSSIFPEVDLTSFGGEAGGVSRQHAKITHSGDQWMITDLNSTNYTRLDGARLEPNLAMPLSDGARVQFGRVATTFHL